MKKLCLVLCICFLTACGQTKNNVEVQQTLGKDDVQITPVATVELPYEDSKLNKLDFEVFNKLKRNSQCLAELSNKECIEKGYEEENPIPEKMKFTINKADENYTYFTLKNLNDNSVINFKIISELCDSEIFDFQFAFDDNNDMSFALFIYYDEETINDRPYKYNVEEMGGPLLYHTAYFITKNNDILTDSRILIGEVDGYMLVKEQSFTVSDEYKKKGTDYLKEIEIMNFY